MVLSDQDLGQGMNEAQEHDNQQKYAGIQHSYEKPPVSSNHARLPDARTTANDLSRPSNAVEVPPPLVAPSSSASQSVLAPSSSSPHPPANHGDFGQIRDIADFQASSIAQPLTAGPPVTQTVSTTTQQPAYELPPIDFQDFVVDNSFLDIESPASLQVPMQGQPSAHQAAEIDPNPPTNVQDYIDLHDSCKASRMVSALAALEELEKEVSMGFEAFSKCHEVFYKSKTLAEIARGLITKVMHVNAGGLMNHSAPVDPAKDTPPSSNDTAPIDTSKDQHPSSGDTDPLHSSKDKYPYTNDTASAHPSKNKYPSTNDTAPIDTSKNKYPSTNDTTSIDLSRDPRPGARARLAAQNASDARPRFNERASPHTRQASTDDTARRRQRHSSTNSAPNVIETGPAHSASYNSRANGPTDSTPKVTKTGPAPNASYSSRANGPTDTIDGMAPAYHAHRLRILERTSLPKGNIHGIAYNCEGRCGYPDSATESLIQCESTFHAKQPSLRQPDGTRGGRGWYHGPCGNVAPDDEPNEWICPACVQRGTTSTTNDDEDDEVDERGGDDHESDHNDDSEDNFSPDQDTPSESSDDDAGGDAGAEGEKTHSHQRGRSQQSNTKHGGKTRRYILDSDSEDGMEDDEGDQDEIWPSIEHDSQQPDEGANGNDGNDGYASPNPAVWITRAGEPWTEVEKVKTIKHMKDICNEGKITGEERFRETSRRLRTEGYQRHWVSVKNIWNRGLRQRSGIDERRNKRAPLTTSKQDAKTKRENKEKKEQKRRSNQSESVSSRHVSVKRELESGGDDEDEEEDEVVPPKRRRAAPFAADYFPGLK